MDNQLVAPVAQLDRASASGVEGRGFESRRVYHFFLSLLASSGGGQKFIQISRLKFPEADRLGI